MKDIKRQIHSWTGAAVTPTDLLVAPAARHCCTTTPLCSRRPPNQGLCSPHKLSTYTGLGQRVTLSVGELRPGQGPAGTQVFGELAQIQVCWVLGTRECGEGRGDPHADPCPCTSLAQPQIPPDPWWKLPRSTPALVQTGKYDNYLPKGVSDSVTTYQTWNAPTFLRANLQGRRQVGEEST